MATTTITPGVQGTTASLRIWRIAQGLVWLIGATILYCLFFVPELGITLFWNLLIPVAPALLVISPGLWRNVCPLASTSLLPRYLGLSQRKKMTTAQTGRLNLIGVLVLLGIVPLRHLYFDWNGPATTFLILSLALIAVSVGFLYEWKSAWCSGLCPVHPVEKLYGRTNRISLPNAHCGACHKCVTPCPDSTPGISPLSVQKTLPQKIAGFLMVGAFPGFVWGWFQVPDSAGIFSAVQLLLVYLYPALGMLVTGSLFWLLCQRFNEKRLIPYFAAATVSCYYGFRLPALFGYGQFPGDGMLLDLTGSFPEWTFTVFALLLSVFFVWWIVFHQQRNASWVVRPAFAKNGR